MTIFKEAPLNGRVKFQGYTKPYRETLQVMPDSPQEALTKAEIARMLFPNTDIDPPTKLVSVRLKHLREWTQQGGYQITTVRPEKNSGDVNARYYKSWIGQGQPIFPVTENFNTPDTSTDMNARFMKFRAFLKEEMTFINPEANNKFGLLGDVVKTSFTYNLLETIHTGRLEKVNPNLLENLQLYILKLRFAETPVEILNELELNIVKAICLSLADSWQGINANTDWQKMTNILLKDYQKKNAKLIQIFAQIFIHFKTYRFF